MSKLGKNKKNANGNKKKKEQNKKDQKHAQVVSVSSTLSDTPNDDPLNDVANSKPDMRCKFHSGRLQSNVCVYMPKQMFTSCTKKNRLGRAAGKS